MQPHQVVYCITYYLSKYCVFLIQMFTWSKGHKKLWIICIFPSIGHCNNSSSGKLESLMKLILKRLPINRLTSHARSSGIPTLNHEPWYKSMKNSIRIVSIQTMLDKIFTCQWCFLRPKLNIYFPMARVYDNLSCSWRLLCCYLTVHII